MGNSADIFRCANEYAERRLKQLRTTPAERERFEVIRYIQERMKISGVRKRGLVGVPLPSVYRCTLDDFTEILIGTRKGRESYSFFKFQYKASISPR